MPKIINLIALLVAAASAGYLICSPMELENFFLSRWISKLFFPKLDPFQRHRRMQQMCGIILATIICIFLVVFLIKQMSHR